MYQSPPPFWPVQRVPQTPEEANLALEAAYFLRLQRDDCRKEAALLGARGFSARAQEWQAKARRLDSDATAIAQNATGFLRKLQRRHR